MESYTKIHDTYYVQAATVRGAGQRTLHAALYDVFSSWYSKMIHAVPVQQQRSDRMNQVNILLLDEGLSANMVRLNGDSANSE